MKKIKLIILLLAVLGLSKIVFSQEKIEIGAKTGLQTPKFWNGNQRDVVTSNYRRYRAVVGLFTKYHFNKVFFAEYDLGLSWEGGGFEKRRTNLTFLKNTLFIAISTNVYKSNSFNLKGGISHNTLLSGKLDDKFKNTKTNVSRYFKTSSFSYPISIGYVRKINEQYRLGLNTCFQIFSQEINTQEHIKYGQTFNRLEIKISKFIK